ncbi:MAG: hypothetical protein HYZ37_09645 [Candidatus Solibacter usitatus]|nr:hypothetical protein [Candidatus Solibacter usitatus]
MPARKWAWIAVGLALAGCHKPPAKVRQVRPPLVFPKPKSAPPPDLPEAPAIASKAVVPEVPPRIVISIPPPPAQPAPKKAVAIPSRKVDVTPPTARLGELLTDAQRLDYTKRYEAAQSRASASLALILRKPLTANQRADAGLVRTFLAQAEEERLTDLAHAVNLAERADLLAKSLLARLP